MVIYKKIGLKWSSPDQDTMEGIYEKSLRLDDILTENRNQHLPNTSTSSVTATPTRLLGVKTEREKL